MNIASRCIAVIGASSFIGRHLVKTLSGFPDVELRLLIHENSIDGISSLPNVHLIPGDLLKPEGLSGLLKPGCTVINLAYLRNSSEADNIAVTNNIVDACCRAKIKRFVHCSTAVVVGSVSDRIITETTECRPTPGYEQTKWNIEQILEKKAVDNFELAILRPTAVFGSGGKNLLKLADELRNGNRIVNYIKSCLYDSRRMNLVCVDNVVSALIFLVNRDGLGDDYKFIISDDDVPLNNYRDVEKMLMRQMGYRDYAFPRVILHRSVLSFVLRLAGRPNTNPDRIYESSKLQKVGYVRAVGFENGIDSFINSYMLLHKMNINKNAGSSK